VRPAVLALLPAVRARPVGRMDPPKFPQKYEDDYRTSEEERLCLARRNASAMLAQGADPGAVAREFPELHLCRRCGLPAKRDADVLRKDGTSARRRWRKTCGDPECRAAEYRDIGRAWGRRGRGKPKSPEHRRKIAEGLRRYRNRRRQALSAS
jgi:hypothetical protein